MLFQPLDQPLPGIFMTQTMTALYDSALYGVSCSAYSDGLRQPPCNATQTLALDWTLLNIIQPSL